MIMTSITGNSLMMQEANELHHLMIMESLGGDQLWLDRFFAQHCAVFYFWAIILTFVFSPTNAYIFSELVEVSLSVATHEPCTFMRKAPGLTAQAPCCQRRLHLATIDMYFHSSR